MKEPKVTPDNSANYHFAVTDRVIPVENGYSCPNCGKHAGSEGSDDSMIAKSHSMFMDGANPGYVWEEVHLCPDCSTVYKIENGT